MATPSVLISPRLQPRVPLDIRFYVMSATANAAAIDLWEVNDITFMMTREQTITLRDSLNALIELDPDPAPEGK